PFALMMAYKFGTSTLGSGHSQDPRKASGLQTAGCHSFSSLAQGWPMINEKEITMASNEEIIRNLYAVAEKEPKRFRSLFTENGYWWDVPAGVKYHGDEVARAADIYSVAFPDMYRELHDLYFDGGIVVVQLTLHGTHKVHLTTA